MTPAFVSLILSLLLLLLLIPTAIADPASLQFTDCFDVQLGTLSKKLNISTVYAQVLNSQFLGTYLNLTVLGASPQDIVGFTSTSDSLTTLFSSTSILTLNAFTNSSYFCQTLRPPSPLQPLNSSDTTYCPIPAGPFAFSTTIPWGNHRALTTLTTQLRAVDPLVNELFCINVVTTPLQPVRQSPYGWAKAVFWLTVGLALAYWLVIGLARIASAWGRGITRHDSMWSRARSAGFILASAISGETLASSPALMRFCTPSMRDVFFHTQWCAVLAMVAVQWPPFVYPLLTQTAWTTLSYNVTILQSAASHWNPLYTPPYSPPQNFADQLNDSSSPIFVDPSIPNSLFTLPQDAKAGISSFAYTVGVRPQDLFPICMVLFLGILAAVIVLAIFIGLIDHLACFLANAIRGSVARPNSIARMTGTRSPGFTSIKESPELLSPSGGEESKSIHGQNGQQTTGTGIFRASSRLSIPLAGGSSGTERGIHSHRAWWRFHIPIGSFHGTVLQGNAVRVLVYFHLPVTIFSAYQMTLPRDQASLASKALAGLSVSVFSILIPAYLVFRVTFTTTNKLYAETNTLLCLGPLYNYYRHGSQLFASLLFATNLVFGVTIGAVQASGTAQAIIILIVEVASALVTSIWLPWGAGASMGLISFLFCVARIVIAVLLVILTPTINIGSGAAGWVAYGILVILALVFLALSLLLIVKLIEALVRILGGVGFDSSKHAVDSGLLGACSLLGCCGPRKRSRKHQQRPEKQQHPYDATQMHAHQDKYRYSDGSSYIPPVFPNTSPAASGSLPRFHHDSRKGSANSGPPPSVLRPEHATRPYKEDDEDEGYIMGAWQRISKPRYAPVLSESPLPHTPTSPSQLHPKAPASASATTVGQTGFSRVGGGRAHIDSPYAITSGSTYTFPTVGRPNAPQHPAFPDADESPPPSLSAVSDYRHDYSVLPPGAMHPSHVRTKSQTAVIEDAGILAAMSSQGTSTTPIRITPPSPEPGSSTSGALLRLPVLSSELPADHDEDSEHAAKKKRPWYRMKRHRATMSDGSIAQGPSSPPAPAQPRLEIEEELGGLNATPQSGRSFVVIRKPQSNGRLTQPGPNDLRSVHATT